MLQAAGAGRLTASSEATATSAPWRRAALLRRSLLATIVIGQCGIAAWGVVRVLPYHGADPIEISLAAVFSLLFFGISVGSWFGIFGFLIRLTGGDRLSPLRRHPAASLEAVPLARTAIVMPIYHEPIERTFAGLRAVYQSVEATGQLACFDFFILSDSRDPEIWLAEQKAWHQLCRELGAEGRLFYRRRQINLKHKSGNIADFFRRWGSSYAYAVVLDADSLMAGGTIVRMVRLMEAEPRIGILQTAPALVNARSLFARTQQFANRLYGPIFSTGLAALQLGEATYWGHNAILRCRPFMRHCGLKKLPGRGLFGGPILSHDFVEAAYMARAGYEIWLEPGLQESFEESPPTLVEDLTRDRRWSKGNLQHLRLLFFAPRIRMAHRLAFLNGAMSYLASPLWLAFLILATVETTRLVLQPINYFPARHSPFPVWPEWHPELALALASSTFFLLLLPKLLAFIDAVVHRRLGEFGGLLRLTAGILLESLISALLAPTRMLAHSRYVIRALFNLSLLWAGQNRGSETGWRATLVNQLPGTILAICWAIFAFRLEERFFLWSLPVVIPLVMAAPISIFLGRISTGQQLRRWGLLLVAEELEDSHLLRALERPLTACVPTGGLSLFAEAVIDPAINRLHRSLGRRRRGRAGEEMLARLRDLCLKEGPAALTTGELAILARDSESLEWLHQAVWLADRESRWASLLPSDRLG
ncbi:MAG: glucans biosynthesis glucosyltransferase MdoH [Desulfobulbaceae bacterium]|nr:MAG: glucans biosynthesis glucosyltransferase MdoH [Desulfobulbaceae bacterium]